MTLRLQPPSSKSTDFFDFEKFVGLIMRQAAVKGGLVNRPKDVVENEPCILYKDLPSALLTSAIKSKQH